MIINLQREVLMPKDNKYGEYLGAAVILTPFISYSFVQLMAGFPGDASIMLFASVLTYVVIWQTAKLGYKPVSIVSIAIYSVLAYLQYTDTPILLKSANSELTIFLAFYLGIGLSVCIVLSLIGYIFWMTYRYNSVQ